jgi:hypothetical protein
MDAGERNGDDQRGDQRCEGIVRCGRELLRHGLRECQQRLVLTDARVLDERKRQHLLTRRGYLDMSIRRSIRHNRESAFAAMSAGGSPKAKSGPLN